MNNRQFLNKLAAESPAKLAEWFDEEHEHRTSVSCDACLYKKQYDDLEAECEETARLLSECTIKRVTAQAERDELRSRLSQAIDNAHETVKLLDLEAF